MAIKVFNIPKLARNKYNYVKDGTTVINNGGSSADIDTSNFLTQDWFYKDEDGNIHCPENLVGDKSVSALGIGEGGDPIDLSNYYTKQQTYNKSEIDSKVHTHSNKAILDNIKLSDIDKWNAGGGGGSDHTHSNLAVLNNLTLSVIDNSHSHSNKSTLDGITSTKVSNWDSAASNSHTHSNKSTLDGITSAKVSNWDSAATNSHTHSNKSVLDSLTQAQLNFLVSLMNHITINGDTMTFDTNIVSNKGITALQ